MPGRARRYGTRFSSRASRSLPALGLVTVRPPAGYPPTAGRRPELHGLSSDGPRAVRFTGEGSVRRRGVFAGGHVPKPGDGRLAGLLRGPAPPRRRCTRRPSEASRPGRSRSPWRGHRPVRPPPVRRAGADRPPDRGARARSPGSDRSTGPDQRGHVADQVGVGRCFERAGRAGRADHADDPGQPETPGGVPVQIVTYDVPAAPPGTTPHGRSRRVWAASSSGVR